MKNVLPVMVNTWEAMIKCASENISVIYVMNSLYKSDPDKITQRLAEYFYEPAKQPARRGVFFQLTQGEYRFDPDRHVIYDPLNTF